MPLYVYTPLRRMLSGGRCHAGRMTGSGELIPDQERSSGTRSATLCAPAMLLWLLSRRHEDELAAALRRLEEQDRLVSLGLLSRYASAHELNTPLGGAERIH